MNRLLLEPAEVVGTRVRLGGRRAQHLLEVLRVEPGRTLRAGIIDGPLASATVVAVAAPEVELELVVGAPAPPLLPVTLWLAVPRPKVLARVLQAVAAIGVARIELTRAWRVDKAYLGSPRLSPTALRRELVLGAEQGGGTCLPAVRVHDRFMALVDGGIDGARALVADPGSAVPIETCVTAGPWTPTVVAIGPEGGWMDRELDTLVERGFHRFSLGAPILRTEAAVVAALAQLTLLARLPPM